MRPGCSSVQSAAAWTAITTPPTTTHRVPVDDPSAPRAGGSEKETALMEEREKALDRAADFENDNANHSQQEIGSAVAVR